MNTYMLKPLGIDEARERLSAILRGFASRTHREAVPVGRYRQVQGVIVPIEEYEDLLAAREERTRARAALEAIVSVRLEGGEPTPAFTSDLQSAIAGDLDTHELVERTLKRYRDG